MNENNRTIYLFSIILVVGLSLVQIKKSNLSHDITENEIMDHIRYLSHQDRGGRYPGTRESKDVIAYLTKELKSYGIKPGAGSSYVQPFNIKTGIRLVNNNYAVINKDTLSPFKDYTPLFFSSSGVVSGPLVFAGYGFNINNEEIKWNDYKDVDVTGKWVMVMRHGPERGNQNSGFSPHMPLHKKMLVARDQGAIGIIFISQIEDENLYPLSYVPGYNNDGLPSIHLSNKTADQLLKKLGWSRKSLQETMNRSLESIAFDIKRTVLKISIDLEITKSRAANVVGKIKSGNRKYRDEYIVIGAHFDHLGYGGAGSGSRTANIEALHPGANDNASGTAGLLELAQKLSSNKSRLKRSILLVGFDAEEKGLLGSKYFVENPPVRLKNIVSMINMDMIGGIKDSTVNIGGVGTSPTFRPLLDSLKTVYPLKFSISTQGLGPSDHASFYSKDIPVLFFFSGFHDEYHTPEDTWKNINLKGEKDLLDLIYDVIYNISRANTPPVFSKAGPQTRPGSTNMSLRVTLGIMPSYNSTNEGLEIDDISKKDGPAARAGMKKGDVIKSINQKPIKNIYEYMDRLGELKKGMVVPVGVERNGKTLTLSVTF